MQLMDRVQDRVAFLKDRLGVDIRLEDDAESLSDARLKERIRSGKANGWTDAGGTVHLLRRGLRQDDSYVDSAVFYQAVSHMGLERLLGPAAWRSLCLEMAASGDVLFPKGAGMLEIARSGQEWISLLPDRHTPSWDRVTESVARHFGIPSTYALASAVSSGESRHRRKAFREAERTGDVETLQGALVSTLSGSHPTGFISFGVLSEPYLRLGYPAIPLRESAGHLSGFMSRNGLSGEFVDSLVEKVRNPIAVIRGRRGPEGARDSRWLAVTDVETERGVRLAVVLDSPSDVMAAFRAGTVDSVGFRGLALVDEPTLLNDLFHREDGVSQIRYLRPRDGVDGRSYDMSRVLKRMEGRDLCRRKEGAAGTPLVASPMDISRRLNDVANIVENFRNPMSEQRFVKLYGHSRQEASVERTGAVQRIAPAQVEPERPAPVGKPGRTFRERLMTPLWKSGLGETSLKKLHAAGIRNASDVIAMGEDKLREKFGTRMFNVLSAFILDQGLSFGSGKRYNMVPVASFSAMDAQQQSEVRYKDLGYALENVPESIAAGSLRMPCDAEGIYFSGANAASLVARMSGVERWKGCNVFLDEDQIKDLGISLSGAALPCYMVCYDDTVKPYYNLADTSLAREPGFGTLREGCQLASEPVPSYLSCLLPSISGSVASGEARGLYGWLDLTCRNRFRPADFRRRPKPLKDLLGVLGRESVRLERKKGNEVAKASHNRIGK